MPINADDIRINNGIIFMIGEDLIPELKADNDAIAMFK
jgi:hypothetical protein